MSKIPMIANDQAPSKPAAPPMKHGAPMKGAPVDHKAAIQKMHPEHVHRLVQDAHAGKFGPEAQRTAQQAMQPQAPMQDQDDQQQQAPPQRNVSSIFAGGNAPAAAPAAPASRASMF